MKVIALVGKPGSGKTEALNILNTIDVDEKPCRTINLDSYTQEIYTVEVREKLSKVFDHTFSTNVLTAEDRNYVVYDIFTNYERYCLFCDIILPEIAKIIDHHIIVSSAAGTPVLVIEGPITLHPALINKFDAVFEIESDEQAQQYALREGRNAKLPVFNTVYDWLKNDVAFDHPIQNFSYAYTDVNFGRWAYESKTKPSTKDTYWYQFTNPGTLSGLRVQLQSILASEIRGLNLMYEFNVDLMTHLVVYIDEFQRTSHRAFHTTNHVLSIVTNISLITGVVTDAQLYAAVFHDYVYDVNSLTNEEDSVQAFLDFAESEGLEQDVIDEVVAIILATKDMNNTSLFNLCDRDILFSGSVRELIEYEHQIFKEHQQFDWTQYRSGRLKWLKEFDHYNKRTNVPMLIEYLQSYKPNIAIYPGSFNPFHVGHYNVLQKAEAMFDKVIIVKANNPDKPSNETPLPEVVSSRQLIRWDGLMSELIDQLGYDVTLIRGVRNAQDYEDNKIYFRYVQELLGKPLKSIMIQSDVEYEHVSSSAFRAIARCNPGLANKYLV